MADVTLCKGGMFTVRLGLPTVAEWMNTTKLSLHHLGVFSHPPSQQYMVGSFQLTHEFTCFTRAALVAADAAFLCPTYHVPDKQE